MSGEGNIGDQSALLKVLTDLGVKAGDLAIKFGVHVTVDADDDVDTGLSEVLGFMVTLSSDPVLTMDRATGKLTAGVLSILSWMPTDLTLTTPIPATTFVKNVAWIAIGRE